MILPELPRDHMRWDRYKAFHWGVGANSVTATTEYYIPPFIVFDTQEVICTMAQPAPDYRGRYDTLNVSLVATGAPKCPQLYDARGRTVPKAWLNQNGQQYLLIDHDTKQVVSLTGDVTRMAERVPLRFCYEHRNRDNAPVLQSRIGAWFPGPGRLPVGHPVIVDVPKTNKEWLTDAEREHIATITDTCKMAMRLQGIDTLPAARTISASRLLEVTHFEQLTLPEQMIVANGEVVHVRMREPYLCVK